MSNGSVVRNLTAEARAARQGSSDLEAGPSTSQAAAASEDEVIFRELHEADLPELKDLQRGLFPVQYSDNFYMRLLTEGHYTIVGVTRSGGWLGTGEIVAVASTRIVQAESSEATPGQREAYIMTLGVKESFRRRSLGTAVMRECLQLLRERTLCDIVTLHVKSDNLAALAFYQKYGFTIDPNGFCKDHYLIDGVMYHAFRLTYAMPQPASSSYLGFLPRSLCTVI